MRQLISAAPAAVLLLLAACGGADEPALPQDDETAIPVEPDGGVGTSTPAAESTEVSADGIPDPLRGRWGLVAADCEPGRSDAKGLMTVSADQLRFYESVGKLGQASERTPTRLRAAFAFTGEGMSWSRDMTLEVQDGGKTLVRQEFGDDAAPEPFRYTRCS